MTDLKEGMSEGALLMCRIDELAKFSSKPGCLERLYLTPEHKEAADHIAVLMKQAGMVVHMDGVGTVVGRYEGALAGAPALLVGSHIDTVRDAGRFDGSLGVLAAIQAVELLNRKDKRLPFAVEVLAFGDEEGVRFPTTLSGSRAIAGTFDPATLELVDADGVTMSKAIRAFGCDPATIPLSARTKGDALGFVELHIEQGPVLQSEDLPIAVVTAINGASRFAVEVEGEAGHAGTVPMNGRKDALAAACEMVLAIELVGAAGVDLVATVGRLETLPGAGNVIPGKVLFSIDIRSPRDADREEAIELLHKKLQQIALSRSVRLKFERIYDEEATNADPGMRKALCEAIGRVGLRAIEIPSGAGHDAMAIGSALPMGMLFLRCKDGISHNPAEEISEDDAGVAVTVLHEFLCGFDPALLNS